jgi:hypothetical protein
MGETKKSSVHIPIIASSGVNLGRRGFIRASPLLIASTLLAGGTFWINVARRVEEARDLAHLRRQMMLDLMFGQSDKQYYTPSFDNPYSPICGVTAPTRDALASIFSHLGFSPPDTTELKELGPRIIDGSLLLLGGPVPNPLSRSILGVGAGSPLFQGALGRVVQLPVHFANIQSVEVGPGARPQYQLVADNSPVTLGEGVEDCLVITSIPNVYSPNYQFRHRLFNLAGLHGGGTRAIDLVLRGEFLEKFYKMVRESSEFRDAPGWQAVIRVDVDRGNSGIPLGIKDWRAFRINMDEEDFARVNEHVRKGADPIEMDH